MKLKKIFIAICFLPLLSGCLKGYNELVCDYDECALVAPASEIQDVQAYLTANSLVATQHCSGLFYSIDAVGTGANPKACSDIAAKYVGRLTNGTVFDSRSTAIVFNLGQVIRGWTNGLPLIKAGGRITLYIPPSLGYGNTAIDQVPANSILIFDIDLVAVQ